MVFELKGKIALITGGVSGIGLECAKELLQNGVQAVTLADINCNSAQKALSEIEKEFGSNRALFVETDVTDYKQFEYAFKKTVEVFKYVDILINSAGILNDTIWEKEIKVNVNGVVNGILLGLENYLPKYKQGSEAVIVNIASSTGILVFPSLPIYAATKAAVISMTRSWGEYHHYEKTKVRLIAICPGLTNTSLVADLGKNYLSNFYEEIYKEIHETPAQESRHVAQELRKLIPSGANGTLWIVEDGKPAYQHIISL